MVLCSVTEPQYPKAGNGRPPIGLERTLCMYFVQHWFNLADEACVDTLRDGLRGASTSAVRHGRQAHAGSMRG